MLKIISRLKLIVVACDKAEQKNCTISNVVKVWKDLKSKMSEVCVASNLTTAERKKKIEKAIKDRYKMAMTPYCAVALAIRG